MIKNPLCNARDPGLIPGQEDSICLRATKPVYYNRGACTLESLSCNSRLHMPGACAL